jgi:hypothetical protein
VLDEGVADYAASLATEGSIVGDPIHGPRRDLERPPRLSVEGWASLAAAGSPFDPHLLGWDLAAALHARAPRDRALRDDLAVAAGDADAEGDVRAILASFARACPLRSREKLHRALADFVPSELSIK